MARTYLGLAEAPGNRRSTDSCRISHSILTIAGRYTAGRERERGGVAVGGRSARVNANARSQPTGRVVSPWATPWRCPGADYTFAPLAHQLNSIDNRISMKKEDEDCSIWQHMMDSKYHLKLAANLPKDWGHNLPKLLKSDQQPNREMLLTSAATPAVPRHCQH